VAQQADYLSIGEVLTAVQVEFPELSISKIRFLENQGLIDPERTPSGYRKFYQRDIDRLRMILQMQRETYMPLKRIRDTLVDLDTRSGEAGRTATGVEISIDRESYDLSVNALPSDESSAYDPPILKLFDTERSQMDDGWSRPAEVEPGTSESVGPASQSREDQSDSSFRLLSTEEQLERISESLLTRYPTVRTRAAAPPPPSTGPSYAQERGGRITGDDALSDSDRQPSGGEGMSLTHLPPAPVGDLSSADRSDGQLNSSAVVQAGEGDQHRKGDPNHANLFSIEELARLSGAKISEIREIEEFGLIESRPFAGERYYAQIDFEIVQIVTVFRKYGVQARHLKMYKISAEREVGFMEQILSPILRQRNPAARARATEQLTDLKMLGGFLRGYYMEKMLAKYLDLS
jgi:DNA-binding transcriptional MerR regulator